MDKIKVNMPDGTVIEVDKATYDAIYGIGRTKGFTEGGEKANERLVGSLKGLIGDGVDPKQVKTTDIADLVNKRFEDLDKKISGLNPGGGAGNPAPKDNPDAIDSKVEIAKEIQKAKEDLKKDQQAMIVSGFKNEIKANAIKMNLGKNNQGVFPAYVDQYFDIKVSEKGEPIAVDKEGNPFMIEGALGGAEDIAKFIKNKHGDIFPQMKPGPGLGGGFDGPSDRKIDLEKPSEELIREGIEEFKVAKA